MEPAKGQPNEKAAYQDIDAAYEYLTNELHVQPDHIILHGFSLGGAIAADLASRRSVGGLILESTFVSAFRVVTTVPMPFDQFTTLAKLKNIKCPILVIHGRADRIVKFWHGQMPFDYANEPKQFLWIENAGHGDLSYVASEQYEQALRNFAGLAQTQNSH
jgi:abhydrolase domain-containing protein 17